MENWRACVRRGVDVLSVRSKIVHVRFTNWSSQLPGSHWARERSLRRFLVLTVFATLLLIGLKKCEVELLLLPGRSLEISFAPSLGR
jgi:hypothetical protein